MPNPWESDPIVGTPGPVYGAPPKTEPYAAEDQSLQREANARAAAAADRQGREWSATHNPDGTPKPNPSAVKEIPVSAAAGIQANIESLRALDAAIGSLKGRPQSIGPGTGALGDTFTQFNDPQGTNVRSRIGNIGAIKIHDLSGAAVSPTEAPRFQPFVPTVTDRPEIAAQKLTQFREQLAAQIKESLDYYNPKNGYKAYDTPQAQQFLQSLTPATPQSAPQTPPEARGNTTQDGTGTPLAAHAQEFHDQLYSALASKQLKSPADIQAFTRQFNQQSGTAFNVDFNQKETRLAIRNAMQGKPFGVESLADPRITAKVNELKQKGGLGDAAAVGATDAISLGSADELAAAGAALKGSLGGQGSFGDLYGVNADANRIYEKFLQDTHPVGYTAGQVAGGIVPGLAVPGGSVGELAAGGAGLGGAYGFNSGQGLGDRLTQGAMGAGAGAALGVVIPAAVKGLSGLRGNAVRETPPLVDPQTGELNQPMDAMRPADRVQTMRDQGIQHISPGMAGGRSARVIEQGFNNLPGSAGHMEDFNSAASGDVRRAMQGVAQQFGSSKTLNEGGSELQRGAREWMTRFDGVTSNAYNAIPISPQAATTLNNTKATLDHLAGKLESNPALQEEIRDPNLLRYLDAINKHGLTWGDLKDFRTFVGNKIGQFRLTEDARTSDYRSLYAALSEDMRQSAAAQGPRALQAFDRANTLYAQGQQRIDMALTRILGQNTQGRPELAAAAVQAMTKGGKASGDLKTLAQVRAATIKSGAWDEIASTLIHLGGQPANSEGRAFQPATFVQWYADMSEPARQMLFKPELRRALDSFVATSQQISRVRGLGNTSNTTPTMIGSGLVAAGGVAAASHPMALLPLVGGGIANNLMARAWTSPKFVNLITGYGRAVAAGNQNAARSQIGRLQKLAATNPELRTPIVNLLQSIANDNAPNVGMIAASPNQGPQDHTQPQ